MKLTIPTIHPRNPLVAAARFRRAGAHRRNIGSERQRAKRDLNCQIRHDVPT